MNKFIFTLCTLLCAFTIVNSQTATEAFRYSTSDPYGTARNIGTGNSMYNIGADFSAISVNPAGIGSYWKGEFVGTLGLGLNSYTSTFDSSQSSSNSVGSYTNFRLPNLGIVVATESHAGRWATSNWAIGINRTAEYDKQIIFEGYAPGTITDSWREIATGTDPDDLNGFEEGLAYTSGAIYDFEEDNIYESDYQLAGAQEIYHNESTINKGGKSELFIGYGANLNQKILFGASVNLPILNSDVSRTYREMDPTDAVPFFNELTYTSSVNTSGIGINGKFGVMLKPSKFINLSLALHTPTKFLMTDNFNTTLSYDYTDENHAGPIKAESPFGSFQYALTTPWKIAGGIGIIAGTHGFISAGLQWTDYAKMKYDYGVRGNGSSYEQLEREVNASIKQNYGSSLQINAGGELAVNFIRARAGVVLSQSAFNNDDSFDSGYSLGIGYRAEYYFVDLGISYSKQDEGYLPYRTSNAAQPIAVLDYTSTKIAATVGFKF